VPNLLDQADHRPYPVQEGFWIMRQVWNDLLFAHWPVPPEVMRPLIPAQFDLDNFDGQCWIGVVPFHMTNVRIRAFSPIPFTYRFAELNVRTYVVYKNRPGVYFFSLDAATAPAVWAARNFFHLPYFNARMPFKVEGDNVTYSSTRTHHHAPPARLEVTYGPTGPVYRAQPGRIDDWLTARYCLYTTDSRQRVYRGEIRHQPWPLQAAQATFTANTMAGAAGITLPESAPLLQFAKRLEVLIWPLQSVG
jgi:uncharacterized protein YqjF (DUF2071 family)